MDEAKQFLLSAMQTLKDRLGNPLVGAFAVAWCAWNFRIILVIFGNGPGWDKKINYIFKEFMPSRLDWLIHGYAIPGFAALIWIFLLPPIFRKITSWHEKQNNETRKAILKASEARVLTNEDATQLRNHILSEQSKLLTEKEELAKTLEVKNQHIVTLEKTKENQQKTIDEKTNEIFSSQRKIEKLLEENEEMQGVISPPDLNIQPKDIEEKNRVSTFQKIGLKTNELMLNSESENSVYSDTPSLDWPLVTNRQIYYMGNFAIKALSTIECNTVGAMIALSNHNKITKQKLINTENITEILNRNGITNPIHSTNSLIKLGYLERYGSNGLEINSDLHVAASMFSALGLHIRDTGPINASDLNKNLLL